MAAPVVVVFLAGALWRGANERGALACLWLSVLSVPLILVKGILAGAGIHILPENLENPMVFAGAFGLVALVWLVALSSERPAVLGLFFGIPASGSVLWLAASSPELTAAAVLAVTLGLVFPLLQSRREPAKNLWDQSMFSSGRPRPWYGNLWLWWWVLAGILVGIYAKFW